MSLITFLNNPAFAYKYFLESNGVVGKMTTRVDIMKKSVSWVKESFYATKDGGSSAYYKLGSGWAASYPETTGYLIPTLLDYFKFSSDKECETLGLNATNWLLTIQSKEGGWQGLQIDKKAPLRVFNSGMIIDGLANSYLFKKDEKVKNSIDHGIKWIIDQADENGLFTESNLDSGGAYDILVIGCCLYGNQILNYPHYKIELINILDAHLDRFCSNEDFISGCNFSNSYPNTMLLHHIGYTLDGLLISYEILKDEKYLNTVKKYSKKLLSLFEVNKGLSAYIKRDWKKFNDLSNSYSHCLTGYAQMAIVFQKLALFINDRRYENAAFKIMDILTAISNRKFGNKGLDFGLAGSFPVNGNYQKFQIVNWANKYFLDALLLAEKSLSKRRIENG